MAILKATSESLDLTDDYTFTGKLSGHMSPAFFVTRTSSQTIDDETTTTVQFNNSILDTNSGYSTSTYKYTIPVAGKYYIYSAVQANSPGNTDGFERFYLKLNKNSDVEIGQSYYDQRNNPGFFSTLYISNTHDLSVNDTIYITAFIDVTNGGSNPQLQGASSPKAISCFGAYRIGS